MSVWELKHGSHSGRTWREPIETYAELRSKLERLRDERDPNLALVHQSGDSLRVSVRGPSALVQFIKAPAKLPCLTASVGPSRRGYVEFIMGGTRTPVPKAIVIPFDLMERIFEHYFEHGTLPSWAIWVRHKGDSQWEPVDIGSSKGPRP